MGHKVTVSGEIKRFTVRTIPIGGFFLYDGRVFVRIWHDSDENAFHIVDLTDPECTYTGGFDSPCLEWEVVPIEQGRQVVITVGPVVVPAPGEATMDEIQLIRAGKMIQAIKAIRCRTGLGLKEAKDIADKHRERES